MSARTSQGTLQGQFPSHDMPNLICKIVRKKMFRKDNFAAWKSTCLNLYVKNG